MTIKIAFIAGFFDGEGCVSFRKSKNNNGTSFILPAVYITNTNKDILMAIQTFYGFGQINQKKPGNSRSKIHYHYIITKNDDILKFLKTIEPYSIIKKSICQLGIKTCVMRKKISSKQGTYHNEKYTIQDRETMFKVYEQAKELNKRGV